MHNYHTIIGITGGIGTGKSVLSRILRLRGHEVYDCDMEARRIMEQDLQLGVRLEEILGLSPFGPDRTLDRKRVSEVIFADERKRADVNRAVHSAVREDISRRFTNPATECLYVESAILCSSGLAALCGEIWVVTAPLELRISRVGSRSGLSREDVMSRMSSQEEEGMMLEALASEGKKVVYFNNDGEDSLLRQLAVQERQPGRKTVE